MNKFIRTAVAIAAALLINNAAEAHHRHHHHKIAVAHVNAGQTYDVAARPAYETTASQTISSSRREKGSANQHRHTASRGMCQGCVVVTTAAGIDITVHAAYAAKFQALIADLVAEGHRPKFITCFARGHVPGSNHGIGAACDIDQTGWGRTSSFMYHSDGLIKRDGLYSGCAFSHQDCGHVEALRGTYNKAPNLYASVAKYQASR